MGSFDSDGAAEFVPTVVDRVVAWAVGAVVLVVPGFVLAVLQDGLEGLDVVAGDHPIAVALGRYISNIVVVGMVIRIIAVALDDTIVPSATDVEANDRAVGDDLGLHGVSFDTRCNTAAVATDSIANVQDWIAPRMT